MKKLKFLLITAVICLTSTVTFAQVEETDEVKSEAQEKVAVQADELPDAVATTLKEKYAEYNVEKSLKTEFNNIEAYYIVLSKGDESIKIIVDVEGKVFDQEKPEEEK